MAKQGDPDVYFEIHEVYYDKKGVPTMHTVNGVTVGGENLEEINWVLDKMREGLAKPILWSDERFPSEYIN